MLKNTGKLAGRTIMITGASRDIGKAIALKAARDGANIVIAGQTTELHPQLDGTKYLAIYTAAKEIEDAGGKALPLTLDVCDEQQVKSVVQSAVDKFGGIDILVNNASLVSYTSTLQTEMERYDLMNNINTRGTFLVSKECIPHLLKSNHPHILNLSPPLNMNPGLFGNRVAYTIAKYGMSMCMLGMSHEYKGQIGVNSLWPKTAIATTAVKMWLDEKSNLQSRKPDIVADAAYEILCRNPKETSGNFFIDEDVVKAAGVVDLTPYACHPQSADNLETSEFSNVPSKLNERPERRNKEADSAPRVGRDDFIEKIQERMNSELLTKRQLENKAANK